MKISLYEGDALYALKKIPTGSVDLLVSDPPYGISFMSGGDKGIQWDAFNEITDIHNSGAYGKEKGFRFLPRQHSNFMIEFFTPIWTEALRVLKPGSFAFVMASPRSDVYSRQIIAMENAGFNLEFTNINWIYLSGFPKSQNISKSVDRKLGYERDRKKNESPIAWSKNWETDHTGYSDEAISDEAISDEAKSLDGSFAGFQVKPSFEPIIVAMKPLSEPTYVDQALANKHGITWLDDGRVPYTSESEKRIMKSNPNHNSPHPNDHVSKGNGILGSYREEFPAWESPEKGRFPANLLVSDSALDTGKITKSSRNFMSPDKGGTGNSLVFRDETPEYRGYDDSGSFSRYFSLDAWWDQKLKELPEEVQKIFPFLYVPKPSPGEKNQGIYNIPETVNDGRDTPIDNPFQRGETLRKNLHATVKPVQLMSYLITLGSRPGDVVLDPFCGSGTTLIASRILKRDGIGIEKDPKYAEIIKYRLNWGNSMDVDEWVYRKIEKDSVVSAQDQSSSLKDAMETF